VNSATLTTNSTSVPTCPGCGAIYPSVWHSVIPWKCNCPTYPVTQYQPIQQPEVTAADFADLAARVQEMSDKLDLIALGMRHLLMQLPATP
jgi:hypothetical protein